MGWFIVLGILVLVLLYFQWSLSGAGKAIDQAKQDKYNRTKCPYCGKTGHPKSFHTPTVN